MKEILERYANNMSPAGVNSCGSPPDLKLVNCAGDAFVAKAKPAAIFVPDNFEYDEVRKEIQLVILINRQEGTGLGLRIAGGKGSSPYREDDEGIFITRILPESPANKTGLKVGDKLLKVNQILLNDLTHQQAADTLKNAVKAGSQLTLSVMQELDLNKLFFLQIPSIESATTESPSGFRINHNFNTYQHREVEVIFISDHKRYSQLNKGDILLQINGKNVDAISEKDLNKFVVNSNNPKISNEFSIQSLTVYRPFVEDQMTNVDANQADDDSSSQQDNQEQNEQNTHYNANCENGQKNNNKETAETDSIPKMEKNDETPKTTLNRPKDCSTPMPSNNNNNNNNNNGEENVVNEHEQETSPNGYPIEEILIKKINGAMGLSIVGGGHVACHPFGVDHPGIFISKIVPEGPASVTGLRVGDRILKVNNVTVTHLSHDETVDELKRNSEQVSLLVSHDPQPCGMQEVLLERTFPEETIGIRINGGIENKSANIHDTTDEGIFVVNLISDTIAHRDGRLKVGTRIMEVNGHSLLGVKLSEAQSYLIKSSDYVSMVICDGFNVANTPLANTNETVYVNANGHHPNNNNISTSSLPFPRPPPVPLARQSISTTSNGKSNGNGIHVNNNKDNLDSTKTKKQLPSKLPVAIPTTPTNTSSSCNYDNLRNIDESDDSRLTSPDIISNYNFINNTPNKLPVSQSFSNANNYTKTPLNSSNNNNNNNNNTNSTPVNPLNTINNIQHNQANSLPITDKNLMSHIMNNTNISINDPKSQSMFTHNTLNTPVAPNGKNPSDSVRSFKDKMKFFEACKDNEITKPQKKFSYLQEHEIQKLKQEEEKKISLMSQDELLSLSRSAIEVEEISHHKDYATFFSN
jgi:protein scribble